jgi:hypothetical protein
MPAVVELDLSGNTVATWEALAAFGAEFPSLQVLDASRVSRGTWVFFAWFEEMQDEREILRSSPRLTPVLPSITSQKQHSCTDLIIIRDPMYH